MPNDLIRYDLLVQDALKGVVRKVLGDAGREGVRGDHHFYVSFRTDHPGVRLSGRLREKYPQDMTIVLQHQFWDLGVTEHSFEVGLSFSGVPERLLVPFDALTGFFDPSVQFGLKFEAQGEAAEASGPPAEAPSPPTIRGAASEPAIAPPKKPSVPVLARNAAPKVPSKPLAAVEKAPVKPVAAPKADNKADKPKADKPKAKPDAAGDGAEVVSLDAFRKKS